MARSQHQDTLIELLNQEEVWELTHATLSEHVRIVQSGDATTKADVIDVLLHAASTTGTIEHSCACLANLGGGNGVRSHLNHLTLAEVEADLNAALAAQKPKTLFRRPRKAAVEIVLVPSYGTVAESEQASVIRSKAKAGTHHFSGMPPSVCSIAIGVIPWPSAASRGASRWWRPSRPYSSA